MISKITLSLSLKRVRPAKISRLICLPVILLILFVTGCSKNAAGSVPVSQSGFYFNTVITISIYDSDQTEEAFSDILTGAMEQCAYYESIFSKTLEGSDVWNISHAGGTPVAVRADTIALAKEALVYAELSGGKTDPTIASAAALWDFTADTPSLPSEAALAEACTHVDYHTISIDEESSTITLSDPQASLDFGFIAKGYIADRLKEYLQSRGISHATINLGGNVLCIGAKPDNSAFRIGIQYPFGSSGEVITAVSATDTSVVTSGIYERYFEYDGIIYHHMLDVNTGMPMQNELLSVTILSKDSVTGDGLSTTCYLLGLDGGMRLIESLPDVDAIFITDDYQIHYSSGLNK